jgi:hypothetical protein
MVKAEQISDDDLATKVTGNIPIVMLWQTKSEQNSKNTFYFLKY